MINNGPEKDWCGCVIGQYLFGIDSFLVRLSIQFFASAALLPQLVESGLQLSLFLLDFTEPLSMLSLNRLQLPVLITAVHGFTLMQSLQLLFTSIRERKTSDTHKHLLANEKEVLKTDM